MHLMRFAGASVLFLLLSELWDMVIDREAFALRQREIVTALVVGALVTFWRARQDRRIMTTSVP